MDAWVRYVFVGTGFNGLDENSTEEAIKVQIMLFILSASKIKKYGKCFKISNTILVLVSNKMLRFSRLEFTKCLSG